MGTATTKDFFISYTHADKNWAEWIAWHLEEAGYTTILQAWDFHAGGNFVLAMDSATKQAGRTIAVLSPDYFASKYTPSEWAAAFRHDPKGELGLLVPVRVRPCDVEGLLGQVVYIDLVNQDEQTARSTLLASLQSGRQKPAWRLPCKQDRRRPYRNPRQSVALAGLARPRPRWSMPTATTRTTRPCCGHAQIPTMPSSPALWPSQNSSSCPRRRRRTN